MCAPLWKSGLRLLPGSLLGLVDSCLADCASPELKAGQSAGCDPVSVQSSQDSSVLSIKDLAFIFLEQRGAFKAPCNPHSSM